jgi:hypothetical protein
MPKTASDQGPQRSSLAEYLSENRASEATPRRSRALTLRWIILAFLVGLGCSAAGMQHFLVRAWAVREKEVAESEARLSAAESRFAEESRKKTIELDQCQADLDEGRWLIRNEMIRRIGPNHSRPGRDQGPAAIDAKVQKYERDEGRVTIDRGTNDGVEVGAHFEITSRGAFVAEIVVDEVSASSSVGSVYFRVLAKHPAPGDIATEVIPR